MTTAEEGLQRMLGALSQNTHTTGRRLLLNTTALIRFCASLFTARVSMSRYV